MFCLHSVPCTVHLYVTFCEKREPMRIDPLSALSRRRKEKTFPKNWSSSVRPSQPLRPPCHRENPDHPIHPLFFFFLCQACFSGSARRRAASSEEKGFDSGRHIASAVIRCRVGLARTFRYQCGSSSSAFASRCSCCEGKRESALCSPRGDREGRICPVDTRPDRATFHRRREERTEWCCQFAA